jgi:hypothetical protein
LLAPITFNTLRHAIADVGHSLMPH